MSRSSIKHGRNDDTHKVRNKEKKNHKTLKIIVVILMIISLLAGIFCGRSFKKSGNSLTNVLDRKSVV